MPRWNGGISPLLHYQHDCNVGAMFATILATDHTAFKLSLHDSVTTQNSSSCNDLSAGTATVSRSHSSLSGCLDALYTVLVTNSVNSIKPTPVNAVHRNQPNRNHALGSARCAIP